jgi:predicted Na+-dependent transporter
MLLQRLQKRRSTTPLTNLRTPHAPTKTKTKGMGLTLTFEEMGAVFTRQPGLLLLGMALQYTVLPAIGWGISKFWGLTSSLAIGVALVSCMPGGTASNIVAYIAKGDMPLSVMMTTASTLLAVFTTPLLTSLLVVRLPFLLLFGFEGCVPSC